MSLRTDSTHSSSLIRCGGNCRREGEGLSGVLGNKGSEFAEKGYVHQMLPVFYLNVGSTVGIILAT